MRSTINIALLLTAVLSVPAVARAQKLSPRSPCPDRS